MKRRFSLKDLTPPQQKRLYEFLKKEGGRKTVIFVRNTFKHATYESQLSQWRAWYQLQLQFHSLDSMRASFEELLLKKFPKTDPKTVQDFGQAYFTMQAAASGDSETYREMEKLRLLKEKEKREASRLNLDREKWETETCEKLLKAANDKRIQDIANSKLSHAEKIKKTREIYFADVDKLGQIDLPKA